MNNAGKESQPAKSTVKAALAVPLVSDVAEQDQEKLPGGGCRHWGAGPAKDLAEGEAADLRCVRRADASVGRGDRPRLRCGRPFDARQRELQPVPGRCVGSTMPQ